MTEEALEQFYQENLEERLIQNIAKELHFSLEEAMDCYYKSKLARMISEGKDGVQYLDYRALTTFFMEMENLDRKLE